MCEHHDTPVLSRRGFASLALGAAGLGAFPLRARAASHVTALALICIDYRLINDAVRFFDGLKLTDDYDQVELAGAGLAAVSRKFRSSNRAFWDHVTIAKTLHNIQKVVVLDHRDCGAYKVAFGDDYESEHDAETAQHKGVMLRAQAMLKRKHPDLASEFYLMALDGTAERVV
ncbi:MAG: carbonic anhydrase [Rhizomicrobium sp.]